MTVPILLSLYQRLTPFMERWVLAYVRHRVKKGKEDPNRLNERYGIPSKPRSSGSVAWFHGASVGEAVSLLPLLQRLRLRFPHITPLVTTGTVTAAAVIQKSLPKGCIHQYVPLDMPDWIERFLNHWQPDLAVFVESEFWPNLILTCRARDIPLYLVNAHLSEKSYESWRRFPSVIKHLLSCFEVCLAQSKTIAKRLTDLGAPPSKVHVCGNLKFASGPLLCDKEELSRLQSMTRGRLIWVAASTHDGEEDIVADVHQEVKKVLPNLLTIISPRHPRRGEGIAKALSARALSVSRRFCQDNILPSTDIYLADTMGELGLFYQLSDVAFIGGTFVPIGGHNPIEAVLLDCALIWGPHTFKQTEICDVLGPSACAVTTTEEFAASVERLLMDKTLRAEKIKTAHELSSAQTHILDYVMGVLEKTLQTKNGDLRRAKQP